MSTRGLLKRIRLGDEVQTYCGRCKEERTHQVVALNAAGDIERVICRTCQTSHLYRDRQAQAKKAETKSVRRTTSNQFEESNAPMRPARSYSPQEIYAAGDTILHTKFGTGRVMESRTGKIDVKFGTQLRTLLHAG